MDTFLLLRSHQFSLWKEMNTSVTFPPTHCYCCLFYVELYVRVRKEAPAKVAPGWEETGIWSSQRPQKKREKGFDTRRDRLWGMDP